MVVVGFGAAGDGLLVFLIIVVVVGLGEVIAGLDTRVVGLGCISLLVGVTGWLAGSIRTCCWGTITG